jgi:tetratricopeptide (TPR) repeat protein
MIQSYAPLFRKVAEYTEILAKNPRSTVFIPLAEIYQRLNMKEDAWKIVCRGVEHLPDYCPGHAVLGRFQIERGEIEAALVSFTRAISLDGENIAALTGMARAQALKGDRQGARQTLQRAAALHPDDQGIQRMLAALGPTPAPTANAGQKEEDPRTSGVKRGEEPITTTTIAEIYIRQGFHKRALKVYRDLLQADPGNLELQKKYAALRRKIQAESGRQGGGISGEASPADSAGVAVPEAKPISSSRPSGRSEIIGQLERWLGAVRRRKENV